jgi:predicted ferric reductase
MDPEIKQQLAAQAAKIEAIYQSVEKMRKYFFWTMVISIAVIILPLIGLVFAIPTFLSSLPTVENLQVLQ